MANQEGRHPNTIAAFEAALDNGAAVLECDVQRTGDGKLIGLHTVFGWYRSIRGWPHLARWEDKCQIDKAIGHRTNTVCELIDTLDGDVTWNFEAKGRASMRLLLDETAKWAPNPKPVDPDPTVAPRIIVSSGWLQSRMNLARRSNPCLITAGTWREKLRLFFGRRADHVAIVQLPSRFTLAGKRIARQAEAQRIQVHWFGVNSRRRLQRVDGVVSQAGIITDEVDLLTGPLDDGMDTDDR